MQFKSKALCLVSWTMFTIDFGCSTGEPPPFPNMVPCKGFITLDGTPLDHGSITFAPVDEATGQPAYGKIDAGHFRMFTTVSAPGVIIGRYRVRVESLGPRPPAVPGQMPLPGESLIPEKYTNQNTSGLEVDIQKGGPPVKLELSSR